ncbi:MAG: LuxR C-terminal-related transcriptional regulator [Chloroflexi bacterium]|nr:LuxR C-terminal-related transcriptional regulator [Chloroflexota bacterium]
MTEIIRLLGERRLLVREPDEGLGELEIPQSVLEVIGQRLNRLSSNCESILTTAAVIGREFNFQVLGLLSEDTSETQLLELIDEALDTHLIQEIPGQGDAYQFSHALVQQTLRERLSTSRRVRLHARIGDTLEILYGDQPGEHAAELAHHFSEAGPVAGADKLVKYTLLAGERALGAYAHEDALGYFVRGLTAKNLEVEGPTPASDAEAAALLFGLGRAQAATLGRQNLDVAVATLSRAFDFYAETHDVAHAVSVAGFAMQPMVGRRIAENLLTRALDLVPPDSPDAGRLLSRNVLVLGLEEGDYQGAMEASERATAIAKRTGDLALEVGTLAFASTVDFWNMRYHDTVNKGLRAIDAAVQSSNQLLEVSARMWVGIAQQSMGKSNEAKHHALAGLSAAESLRDRFWLATALWQNEMCSIFEGDWNAARDFNERGLAVSPSDTRLLATRMVTEHQVGNELVGQQYLERLVESLRQVTPGPQYDYASAALMISIVARITGSEDQLHIAERAAEMVISAESATPLVSRFTRVGLALMAVLRGDVEAAKEQYAELNTASGTNSHVSGDRILGLLAQTIGEQDQAAAHFEDSLAFCREAKYNPELAWTCHDYAGTLLQRNRSGDRARAMGLLEESISLSSDLNMRPLLERATALQEKTESTPARAPAYPGGLTQREADIIRLIAVGKTDREISEELIIALRTVNTHVSNILNKISAANRAEAASYANQHGLVTIVPEDEA